MLGSVLDKSYGLISIVPKDKNGNPIENLEDYAVMDGKKELKDALSAEEYEMVTATSEFKIKWFFFGKDHAKESD